MKCSFYSNSNINYNIVSKAEKQYTKSYIPLHQLRSDQWVTAMFDSEILGLSKPWMYKVLKKTFLGTKNKYVDCAS